MWKLNMQSQICRWFSCVMSSTESLLAVITDIDQMCKDYSAKVNVSKRNVMFLGEDSNCRKYGRLSCIRKTVSSI